MSDKYLVTYHCHNCLFEALVSLPKKTEAPLYFDCPNCGLGTLKKRKTTSQARSSKATGCGCCKLGIASARCVCYNLAKLLKGVHVNG